MIDQYFGIKELYEVVLKAKNHMVLGSRHLEEGEPVLYFENIKIAHISEKNAPIMARGGWLNMPQVIWEDRSEVAFTLSEGVISSISLGILLSANMATSHKDDPLLVSKKEGPYTSNSILVDNKYENVIYLEHWPVSYPIKKTFIYEYERDVAQKKIYGKRIFGQMDLLDNTKERPCIALYNDKELTEPADATKQYIVDYYYEYNNSALIYTIAKERFNGLFTLEGKFYSKDENEGLNYTNLIYMPKVRVVSDINLRLGERADPSTSVFNIIGLPEHSDNSREGLILKITRLSDDIDGNL